MNDGEEVSEHSNHYFAESSISFTPGSPFCHLLGKALLIPGPLGCLVKSVALTPVTFSTAPPYPAHTAHGRERHPKGGRRNRAPSGMSVKTRHVCIVSTRAE